MPAGAQSAPLRRFQKALQIKDYLLASNFAANIFRILFAALPNNLLFFLKIRKSYDKILKHFVYSKKQENCKRDNGWFVKYPFPPFFH